ncbi:hypothetical protein ACF1BN_32505 [Streptomyces sp. NPDC014861]|uniref:hypothetical protein n=1 Tax=Streptomyces sp. NPDC014861 TaxID=3364923 RepID=UPI0036FB1CF2
MQRSDETDGNRLRWARLALAAVSRKHQGGAPQLSMTESVAIRAYLIREFGVDSSDADRSLALLCSDVLENLELPLETAGRMAERWRETTRERMLQLRRAKNLLTPLLPIRAMLDSGDLPTEEIHSWLDLIPKLP